MTAPDRPGRCVLVDLSAAEAALLEAVPGRDRISAAELDARLTTPAEPVDLVVLGSLTAAPVALAQQVHRLLPDAAVVVLTDDDAEIRRQASYAPGVPLDLLVVPGSDRGLLDELAGLRRTRVDRRRHAAVLAAVARSVAAVGTAPAAPAAIGALLDHAPIAVLVAGPAAELLGWNRRAEALLDLRQVRAGQSVDDLLPGVGALTAPVLSGDGGRPDAAVTPLQFRVGGRADVEVTAVGSQTDDGRPVALLLLADVTAHREAERERDRLAGQVELLARVSESLMQSLDLGESLSRLAGALVPALADWISVQVRDERDQLAAVTVRHRDPHLADDARGVEDLVRRYGAGSEPSRRAADGEAVLLPAVDEATLTAQVPDPALRALVTRLGVGSALAVPVAGRGGVLGALQLIRAPGSAPFGRRDLSLATEIGRRAGIALDNARLYAGQRHLATELQRSLLTEPPVLDFADIAVRYVAAASEAQVGGDWYDAFRQRDGDLTVVIGDVVGHDTRAAAAMGQLRSLVRGIGFTTAGTPGEVLAAVDEAIDGLELTTMATAVVAQLSPRGTDGADLRWANAGHPPPVLLQPDGRARLLDHATGRADLLLGVHPGSPRRTARAVVPPGATLLLYTDGLIEGRQQTIDDGIALLLETVERHARDEPGALCDALLARLVPDGGADDVAVVAVRPRAGAPAGGAAGPGG
ncbi:GAF domain-containing SpoIIE family protein phosphatase [Blastococcus montanus]|uniref:GAF domain-containing SpoIIE family protein phosphatase n=1 Tax=Blastococcus montanus TaxID=3144973 RepID=UPI00320808C3